MGLNVQKVALKFVKFKTKKPLWDAQQDLKFTEQQ